MKTKSIGKCSVWVYGSVLGHAGWIEGKIIEVLEGYNNKTEATRAGKAAMSRLKTETISPSHFSIGPEL